MSLGQKKKQLNSQKKGGRINEGEVKKEKKGKRITFITDNEKNQALQQNFISQQDFVSFGDKNNGRGRKLSEINLDSNSDSNIQEQLEHYQD